MRPNVVTVTRSGNVLGIHYYCSDYVLALSTFLKPKI